MRGFVAGWVVLSAAGGAWSAGPTDMPTQQAPPLAWVRSMAPSKVVRDRVAELINEGRGGVVAALGRPDSVTEANGFVVLTYRCRKTVFQFSFDQRPGRLRTFVSCRTE